MWLFKDLERPTTTLGIDFSGDPVQGFTLVKSNTESSYVVQGPINIRWRISDVLNKKSKDEATLLTCNLYTDVSSHEISSIMSCLVRTVKWMKTLRHPNILNWIAGSEININSIPKLPFDCHVVTERVAPLREYLRIKGDCGNFNLISSWGIHQIAKSLIFLNDDGKLSHNAVRLDAIFVTTAGEWKLGNLDFVEQTTQSPPASRSTTCLTGRTNDSDPYLPPDNCLFDSWGLGCLIWEIFNPHCDLRITDQLFDADNVHRLPSNLLPDYRRLVGSEAGKRSKIDAKSGKRSTVAQFLKSACHSGGFLCNDYVNTLLFLEEIQLKDAQEKTKFLTELTQQISSFPDDVCRHKILPHLVHGLRFGSAGVDALLPVLRLIPLLSETDFQATVLPCLLKLFNSNERATRVRLLEQLPNFVDHIPNKIIQTEIFGPVAIGFSDSNPVVREATIRSMIYLAPKLSDKLLNDTLLRHLTTLQARDEQGGIRTNATVCLTKLVPHFSVQTQQGALLSALLRATRDTFAPNRQAAVVALATIQKYLPEGLLACKLLPCLSFLTVDLETALRQDAFHAIQAILKRLEQASKDREMKDQQGPDQTEDHNNNNKLKTVIANSQAATALSQWASSALSFSSRLLHSNTNQNTSGKLEVNHQAHGDDSITHTTNKVTAKHIGVVDKPSAPGTDPAFPKEFNLSTKSSFNNNISDIDDNGDDDADDWNLTNDVNIGNVDDAAFADDWCTNTNTIFPSASKKSDRSFASNKQSAYDCLQTMITATTTASDLTFTDRSAHSINPMKLVNSVADHWDTDAFFDNLTTNNKSTNQMQSGTMPVKDRIVKCYTEAKLISSLSPTPLQSSSSSLGALKSSYRSTHNTTAKISKVKNKNKTSNVNKTVDDGGVGDWGDW